MKGIDLLSGLLTLRHGSMARKPVRLTGGGGAPQDQAALLSASNGRPAFRRWTRRGRSAGILALLFLFAAQAVAASLAGEIEAILDRPAAQRAFWGIKIVDVEAGRTVYEHNPEKLFVPASNAKLFSTALGLARLGPDYRYATEIVAEQAVGPDGVLAGELVFLGGGDPNLSSRVLPYNPKRNFNGDPLLPITELARQIKESGLIKVRGDLIGDDTRYVWQRHAAGWSADDPIWGYGAPASALSFNDNVIALRILPGRAAGQPARVDVSPEVPYYLLENRVRTARSRRVAQALKVAREPGSRTISLWGEMSIRSGGRKIEMAVDDPALFAAAALRGELERLGVTIEGEVRSRHAQPYEFASLKESVPPNKTGYPVKLAAIQSASLAETVKVINKLSQNLHAEMLLREVGYLRRGVGSFEAGLLELKSFLLEAGLKPWEFDFNDASGLSRHSLVSPSGTVQLLRHIWGSPLKEPYVESLPLAGEEGTLDWRFSRTPARGLIRAKTGTLSNVTALSGYATTQDGRTLGFSIFVNNFGVPASYIRKLVDQICVAMVLSLPASGGEITGEPPTAAAGAGKAAAP